VKKSVDGGLGVELEEELEHFFTPSASGEPVVDDGSPHRWGQAVAGAEATPRARM
jgi:hypothetical protein